MRIVADTGPIIALAKIGKISLLKSIAGEVLIPPMVYKELFGKIGSESNEIDRALNTFIRLKKEITLDEATEMALADLGEGEKQAIGLASNLGEDILLLIDDRAGRRVAEKLNIATAGLVGLLVVAKEMGFVESVGPLIEDLRHSGYWLSDDLITTAKRLAGE
jgi:predicted nucleic acid-binding protein